MLTSWFAHAPSRKAITSSRPKTSLPVTGNLATEIFFGPSRAVDLQVPGVRSRRRRLVQALTIDSTPRFDTVGYRWYRLREFGRILKTATGILLKEHLK